MDENKVKRYTRIKYTTAIFDIMLMLVILALFQLSGAAVMLRNGILHFVPNGPLMILAYIFVIYVLYSLLEFPLTVYRSFIVEHEFGLSSQKFGPWFSDLVKAEGLSFIVFAMLIEVFYAFMGYFPVQWWWMSAIFWIFVSIVIARIFPVVVIPLFFKYKTIGDESLKGRILDLSIMMGVKVLDVYEIDFSKKSTKANAALVGLGKSKRVIFTDTLLGKYSPDEIEAVMAHEFAHHKLHHLIKLVVMSSGVTAAIFYMFSKIGPDIFTRLGLAISDVAGLGIWLFLFMVFQIILTPILNFISRNMEKNADLQALKYCNSGDAFVSMLEKLTEQNMSERKPGFLAKIFFYDHPPVDERIALAKEDK
jgi:STE24 endopeptidase